MKTIRDRVKRGLGWSLISATAGRIGPIMLMALLARILGLEGFGRFATVYALAAGLAGFMEFGLSNAIMRGSIRSDVPDEPILDEAMHIGVGVSVMALLAAIVIGAGTWAADGLEAHFVLIPLIAVPMLWATLIQAMLLGREAQKSIAFLQAFNGGAIFMTCVVCALAAGYSGALAGFLLASAATATLTLRAAKRHGFLLSAIDWRLKPLRGYLQLIRISLPVYLSNLLFQPVMSIAILILSLRSGGPAEVALFQAALQAFSIAAAGATVVTPGLMPIIIERVVNGETGHALKISCAGVALVTAWGMFVLAPVYWIPESILGLFGSEYKAGAMVLQLNTVAGLLSALTAMAGPWFIARNQMVLWLIASVVWAAVFLAVLAAQSDPSALALSKALLSAHLARLTISWALVWVGVKMASGHAVR